MKLKAIPIAGLNHKRKYIIIYNDNPIMFCGGKEVPLVMTVIQNGKIDESVPIEKGKQGRILKLIKQSKIA